jgi:hypothetical protein
VTITTGGLGRASPPASVALGLDSEHPPRRRNQSTDAALEIMEYLPMIRIYITPAGTVEQVGMRAAEFVGGSREPGEFDAISA